MISIIFERGSFFMKEIEIHYSRKDGIYVSSYELAKATGRTHQNLMAMVRRKHKTYIGYYFQDNQFYKKQKIYRIRISILRKINQNHVYDELLERMEREQKKKQEEFQERIEKFFSKLF